MHPTGSAFAMGANSPAHPSNTSTGYVLVRRPPPNSCASRAKPPPSSSTPTRQTAKLLDLVRRPPSRQTPLPPSPSSPPSPSVRPFWTLFAPPQFRMGSAYYFSTAAPAPCGNSTTPCAQAAAGVDVVILAENSTASPPTIRRVNVSFAAALAKTASNPLERHQQGPP